MPTETRLYHSDLHFGNGPRFLSSGGANFSFTLREDEFPYITQNLKTTVDQLVLYAQSGTTVAQRRGQVAQGIAQIAGAFAKDDSPGQVDHSHVGHFAES